MNTKRIGIIPCTLRFRAKIRGGDSRLRVKLDKLTMNGLINVYFQLFANLLVKYKEINKCHQC